MVFALQLFSICFLSSQLVRSLAVPVGSQELWEIGSAAKLEADDDIDSELLGLLFQSLESYSDPKRVQHKGLEKATWDANVPWQRTSCTSAELVCDGQPCAPGERRTVTRSASYTAEAIVQMQTCQIPDADNFVSSFGLRTLLLLAKRMETHLGDLLSAEVAVKKIVDLLLDRWLKLLSTLKGIEDLAEHPNKVLERGEPQATGSVDSKYLKSVVTKGNLREKLTYIYSTVWHATSTLPQLIKSERDQERPDEIKLLIKKGIINEMEWNARVNNSLETDTGIKYSVNFGEGQKPHFAIFPGTPWGPNWIANQRNYRYSASEWGDKMSGVESTCQSSVGLDEFNEDNPLSPLTERETELMKSELMMNNPGEDKVTWCPGDNLHAVKYNTDFSRAAHKLGFNTMAGPSGTTDRFMGVAKFLNLKGEELKILKRALLAWMLPAHDHSFIEICMGAEPHCKQCRELTDETTFEMKPSFGLDHYIEIIGEEPEAETVWQEAGKNKDWDQYKKRYDQYKERHAVVKEEFQNLIDMMKKKVLKEDMVPLIEPVVPGSKEHMTKQLKKGAAKLLSKFSKGLAM